MSAATSWGRRGLLGLLFALACLGVTLSLVAVWASRPSMSVPPKEKVPLAGS